MSRSSHIETIINFLTENNIKNENAARDEKIQEGARLIEAQYFQQHCTQQEFASKFAAIAINSIIFASGGSIVALIAYVGSKDHNYTMPYYLYSACTAFFYSIFFSIFCAASAYVSQMHLQKVIDSKAISDVTQHMIQNYGEDRFPKEYLDAYKKLENQSKTEEKHWMLHLYFTVILGTCAILLFLVGGVFSFYSFTVSAI